MGIYPDMIGDSRFLNDLGGYTRKYGMFFFNTFPGVCNEVTAAWSKFGISVSLANVWGFTNNYYRNGQKISREDAMRYACQQAGKNIRDMNFTDY